ncbi:MAG: S8 family peptidase, partial [Paramuribaculum sp.]|nr:S8 family peptidase [Paramuribaculum sp.]
DFGTQLEPAMWLARNDTGVNSVHSGSAVSSYDPVPYTGKGVLAGVYDTGFDLNHINFKDQDGKLRIKRMHLFSSGATPRTLSTERQILQQGTDRENQTHGTHVLGMLAGSYRGETGGSEMFNYINTARRKTTTKNNPYYGVAYESTLYLGAGNNYTSEMLYTIQKVIEQGKRDDMPVVFNLSFGSNTGPHDGTTSFGRAISELSKDAIILISAGNEGATQSALRYEFTDNKEVMKTFVELPASTSKINKAFQIWSDSNKSFEIKLSIVDRNTGETLYSLRSYDRNYFGMCDKSYSGNSNFDGFEKPEAWDNNFSGYSIVQTQTSEDNNRFYTQITLMEFLSKADNKDIALAIEVTGHKDQKIFVYGDSQFTYTANNLEGWTDGTNNGTISDLCCSPGCISVGAYTTAAWFWSMTDNSIMGYNGLETKAISDYSSFGELVDGRTLPFIAAPGTTIVSSYSSYYVKNNPNTKICAKVTDSDGNIHNYSISQGTSMAAPFAAGVVALWLEADPTLTVDDVKDIMTQTANVDKYVNAEPKRFGVGKINASRGLKLVLERKNATGVGSVIADKDDKFIFTITSGNAEVFAAGASTINATVTDLTGKTVATATGSGSTLDISTENLPAGVYILTATDGRSTQSKKFAIR